MVVVNSLTLVVALLPVAVSFAQTVSFAPATHFPVGSNPTSVAIGDLNGDGKPKEAQARMVANYGRIPLHFESNQGQADGKVKFLTRGSGYSMFFTPTEMVLSLASGSPQTTQPTPRRLRARVPFSGRSADPGVDPFDPSGPKRAARETQHTTLRMKLIRANPDPKVIGEKELPGKVNYFIGNDPKQWRSNVATYAKVKYESVYPGIDLLHYGNQRQLEFDFVVAPGADPTRIAFAFAGAEKMELNDAGDLVLHTSAGDVTQHKPIVYQEVDGERKNVEGHYALSAQPALSGTEGSVALSAVSFEVGAYDHDRPLVIDPVLVYSTYLGGSYGDFGNGIAVDAAGNAYVTGYTNSLDFPTTSGAFQTTIGGSIDAFVAKISEIVQVTIDIKPGSFPNSINPSIRGVIPVAILTTATFDAASVDPSTVRFGATGMEAAPVHAALTDVDGDGDIDLILQFNTQDTGIVCGETSASLTGQTFGGQAIEGSDSIRTLPC